MPTSHDVVLLTATVVAPADARSLVRRDTALRLADYLDAFDFYLAQLARGAFAGLVFCENSAFDLAPFAARVQAAQLGQRVELIGHFGLDYPAIYGRGYGEFKLVDHAMRHSALIAAAGEQVHVWKVTGRYKILNIERLIRCQPRHADLYCNCRNRPRPLTDMYLMRWNRRAYEHLLRGAYHAMKGDERPIACEQHFRGLVDAAPDTVRIVPRLQQVPKVEGRRGADDRPVHTTRTYIKRLLARRFAPWFWN